MKIRYVVTVDAVGLRLVSLKHVVTKDTTCAFDFDHIDPSQKVISVSQLVYTSKSYFNEHFQTEAQKCNLLCANCHHLKTH